jgi:hypothetical protein
VAKQAGATTTLEKDVELGNWASTQKDMLATFKGDANAEKKFAVYLKGASSKVKAAAALAKELDNSFKTIIQTSTSLT